MKRKNPPSTATWSFDVEDPGQLRTIVDVVHSVGLQKVTFKVALKNDAYYLMVEMMDNGRTCHVSAHLRLENTPRLTEAFEFCVDCKQLKTALDTPSSAHCLLRIEGYADPDPRVRVSFFDPERNSAEDASTLVTFADDHPEDADLEFTYTMSMEMDMIKLRELLKKAHSSSAEHLRISAHLVTTHSRDLSRIVFQTRGQNGEEHEQIFCHEVPRASDGSKLFRAIADAPKDMDEVAAEEETLAFEGCYPVERLSAFIKHVTSRIVVARLDKSAPILLNHPLADPLDKTQYIRLLVGPVAHDETA